MDPKIIKKQQMQLGHQVKHHYKIAKDYQNIPKFIVIFALSWLIGALIHARINAILIMLLFYDLGCLILSIYHQNAMQRAIRELNEFNKYHHIK